MGPSLPAPPWKLDPETTLRALETSLHGLTDDEAAQRLAADGPNDVGGDRPVSGWRIFFHQFTSPLVLILVGASLISFSLGEGTSTVIIVAIVVMSCILAFAQEYRSEKALRLLRKKLTRYASVLRGGRRYRIDARNLVRGDIVELELGNVVPADLRLVRIEDLEINESVLTGESVPVPKSVAALSGDRRLPQQQVNMALLGTNVTQGSALGVVVRTGKNTEFGRTASALSSDAGETAFQQGVREFGNFLLRITLGLCVFIFLVLFVIRGNWSESLLFALALAVGISPELLPLIVTLNLSRGALAMSRKHVLVKRLIAIEDLGNADVFCTDKTGTLTVGKLRVRGGIDAAGKENGLPLAYASFCLDRTVDGRARNAIDEAVMEAAGDAGDAVPNLTLRELISFDFKRRRMSCVLEDERGNRSLVVKGATAEVLSACSTVSNNDATSALDDATRKRLLKLTDGYHEKGYRLIAVAKREIGEQKTYSPADERDLELVGFVLVSDAPKQSAKPALASLERLNVRLVILTGDNDRVTEHVAKQLRFRITDIVTGERVDAMDDDALRHAVETANVFARITPTHKLRIIQALKAGGHTVGFMGDGVNDAPALHAADVGISFEEAADVAKEAAGVILLRKNLSVLADGIREGRRTFVNIRTYIYATISSNFGNMLSVAGAALLLPFIPMLPAQILLLNFVSDIPMLAIPTDNVAEDELRRPHEWSIPRISNFMYFFGTISSLADYAMFAAFLFVAHTGTDLFRSGWFLGSMLTELVVIFLLRTRRLSIQNPPSAPLLAASLLALLGTVVILQTPVGGVFGLVPLPAPIIAIVVAIVIGYVILTELGKTAYAKFRNASA